MKTFKKYITESEFPAAGEHPMLMAIQKEYDRFKQDNPGVSDGTILSRLEGKFKVKNIELKNGKVHNATFSESAGDLKQAEWIIKTYASQNPKKTKWAWVNYYCTQADKAEWEQILKKWKSWGDITQYSFEKNPDYKNVGEAVNVSDYDKTPDLSGKYKVGQMITFTDPKSGTKMTGKIISMFGSGTNVTAKIQTASGVKDVQVTRHQPGLGTVHDIL